MKNLFIILLLSPLFCFSQIEKVDKETLQTEKGIDTVKVKSEILKIDSIKKNNIDTIRKTEQLNNYSIKKSNKKVNNKSEKKSLNFRKEEWILAIFSIIISALISLFLVLSQRTQIASYHYDKDNSFYFEYKNGFGIKSYTKRGITDNYEEKVKKSEFLEIQSNLVRRVIP